jgi:ElaB/YqjD/DUF883 family membrane-anchored ribosome-binding protein
MVEANIDAGTTTENPNGPLVEAARKVEQGIGTAKERIGATLKTAKEKTKEAAHKVGEKTKETVSKAGEKSMTEVADDVSSYVKDNPGQSVLIALGVGAFVGWLIGRKS